MHKIKKIGILLMCVCIFLSLFVACGTNNTANTSSSSQVAETIIQTFGYQNAAFQIWDHRISSSYCPYSDINEDWLQHALDIYNNSPNTVTSNGYMSARTGEIITLQDVKDYLSSEYNADGSVKTYLNCNDQKITDYVNWDEKNGSSAMGYDETQIYAEYVTTHPAYANVSFHNLTIPQFSAISYKLSNPDYNLDLDNPTANRPQDPVWGKYDSVSS